MQIFKTKWLARFARQESISDASLAEAIARAERGLIDADLGGGLIKQRVARRGHGRSGGYRTIVAFRAQSRAVFLYAFAKSERENIDPGQLASLRQLGAKWIAALPRQIEGAVKGGDLQEVEGDDKNEIQP